MKPLNERLFEFCYNEIKKGRSDFNHADACSVARQVCSMVKTEGEVRAFLKGFIESKYGKK